MRLISLMVLVMFMLVESGCVIRVYKKQMPRKDIIVEGNRGYIVGKPPQEQKAIKPTRTILVTEVELGNIKKLDVQYLPEKRENAESSMDISSSEEEGMSAGDYVPEENREDLEEKKDTIDMQSELGQMDENYQIGLGKEEIESGFSVTGETKERKQTKYRVYKVQKGDTLQKISYKFYGKYSLWPKIYAANRDRLENPDSVYVGQELRIPVLDEDS